MIPDESYIDYRYRKMLFKVFEQQPTIKRWNPNLTYRMECPLCGARNSNLVWMPHRRTWKFLCSTKSRANCQSQMEFPVLLRAWNPELFLSYQQERFEAGTTGFKSSSTRDDIGHKTGETEGEKKPKAPKSFLNLLDGVYACARACACVRAATKYNMKQGDWPRDN